MARLKPLDGIHLLGGLTRNFGGIPYRAPHGRKAVALRFGCGMAANLFMMVLALGLGGVAVRS